MDWTVVVSEVLSIHRKGTIMRVPPQATIR